MERIERSSMACTVVKVFDSGAEDHHFNSQQSQKSKLLLAPLLHLTYVAIVVGNKDLIVSSDYGNALYTLPWASWGRTMCRTLNDVPRLNNSHDNHTQAILTA